MRSSLIGGIIIISALLLEGCGHKGSLMLPAPRNQTSQTQTPQAQTPQAQTKDQQKLGLPSSQPNQ